MAEQITSHILMVRPANFGYNPETAENNAFQTKADKESSEAIKEAAIQEFDTFVAKLREAKIDITVVQDTLHPSKPDAVFPNNWVSFHANGAVITYPIYAPLRRIERREDILELLGKRFDIQRRIRLEEEEEQGVYLEGTGSVILDRQHKLAFACLSERTDSQLLDKFCSFIEYEKKVFHAVDAEGIPIYHTNVMMALGETFVIICMETIRAPDQAQALRRLFTLHGKELINISLEQMASFAGNMLQVRNQSGEAILVMSTQAYNSLTEAQITCIRKHTDILHSPIDTIETYGGGSARCMMAEIFLPEKVSSYSSDSTARSNM